MPTLEYLLEKHNILSTKNLKSFDWENLQGENRPICSVPHCDTPAVAIRINKETGIKKWRRASWIKERYPKVDDIWCCSQCHNSETARRNGVKTAHHLTAQRHGLTLTEYNHRNHPYLKYRKNYCENRDGRLGFVCTFTHPTPEQLEATGLDATYLGWLQVDHIDGNHTNNNPSNLQTLCACCHNVKTYQNGDNATPGRKTRF